MAADKLLTQLNLLLAKVEALQTDLMDLRACTQCKEKCEWTLIKID